MAQLTGNFQGTAAADTFAGSITVDEQTVIDGVATGTAVKQVIIDTFDGNDTISADTRVAGGFAGQTSLSANAIGMTNADISTGSGADKVNITNNGNSVATTTTTGLQNALIETDDGNDAFSIRNSGSSNVQGDPSNGTGVRLATLNGGLGNDSMVIDSNSLSSTSEGSGTATDIGIDQSNLLGGAGIDTITISSKAESFEGGTISSTGSSGNSKIQGDAGSDTISISAIAQTSPPIGGSAQATAKGISNGTFLEGGGGNDVITLLGSATAPGSRATASGNEGGQAQAYGALDAFVFGNEGQDTISITGTSISGVNSTSAFSYGVSNTTVDGGSGNDKITVKATGSTRESGATHHGAVNSKVLGGSGADTIDISASDASNVAASVGALGSTVDGGIGADTIKVRGLKLDIQDSLIQGGGSDDVLDTGIGSGTILGGLGNDLLKLDFFDAATMSIEQSGENGLKISGTVDKIGAAVNWSQQIFEVEAYEIAGTTYSAAGAAALLGQG
jgi:Ca2+-binding RTX toxin-like protein